MASDDESDANGGEDTVAPIIVPANRKKNDPTLPCQLLYLHGIYAQGGLAEVQKRFVVPPHFAVPPDKEAAALVDRANGVMIRCSALDVHGKAVEGTEDEALFPMAKLTVVKLRMLGMLLDLASTKMKRKVDGLILCLSRVTCDPASLATGLTKSAATRKDNLNDESVGTNRLIMALFSEHYRVEFGQLNDSKSHTDIECVFGKSNRMFYDDMKIAVNDESMFATPESVDSDAEGEGEPTEAVSAVWLPAPDSFVLQDKYNEYLVAARDEHPSLPLKQPVDARGIEAILRLLIKGRAKMETNMTTKTGQNEPDPMFFTEVALIGVSAVRKISMFSLYYFFCQCQFFPEVLTSLTTALPNDLLGQGKAPKTPISSSRSQDSKAFLSSLAEQSDKMIASNRLMQDERFSRQDAMDFNTSVSRKRKEIGDLDVGILDLMEKLASKKNKTGYEDYVASVESVVQSKKEELAVLKSELLQLQQQGAVTVLVADTPTPGVPAAASMLNVLDESSDDN